MNKNSLIKFPISISVLKPTVAPHLHDDGGKDPRHRTILDGFSEAPSFVLQLEDVQVVVLPGHRVV